MREEEKNDVLEFPMKFDKCPACGSTKRIAESVGNEIKDAGQMKQEAKVVMYTIQTPIVDATRLLHQVTAPILVSFFDVCADCGTFYCTDSQKIMSVVDVKPQQVNLPRPPG